MELFFNYSIDCELPVNTPYTGGREWCDFFGGPESWEFAQASVRGFIKRMNDLGVLDGTTLFVYPDVAKEQHALYCELADAGIEIGLHLNGLRYSRLVGKSARKWLGQMTRSEQTDALAMAKEDLEEVIAKPCLGYRACYGSANDDTFPICEELGFRWGSNSSGRCRLETYANWSGSWPYPHHANRKSKLVPGEMKFFEIPITRGIYTLFQNDRNTPFDLRVETPPSIVGERREVLCEVIEENIVEMEKRNVPVRAIAGASHNTMPYADRKADASQNLDWIVKHTREMAKRHGLHFVPATFGKMVAEAERVGSY